MKLILTGATGYIGGEVLKQCLVHPSITEIITITRRVLPEPSASNPKIKGIILEDFTSYPPAVLEQLSGADACIWTLGKVGGEAAQAKLVNLDFTIAGARAITSSIVAQTAKRGKKFNFVYVGGMFTERNQKSKPWVMSDFRHMRGEVENQVLALQAEYANDLAVFVAKPGFVLKNVIAKAVMPRGLTIGIEELGAALISVAVSGHEEQTLENADLTVKGRALLT